MARYAEQARKARERLNKIEKEEHFMSGSQNIAPPVARSDTPRLIDADGMQYLNIPELRERGDLVAGYDPNRPQETAKDQEKIRMERELEIAKENAQAAEVARLEAEKKALEDQAKAQEQTELAQANARNLELAQQELEREREENAAKLAEMQAKMDAMAKQLATQAEPTQSFEEEDSPSRSKAKVKAPKRKQDTTDTNGEDHSDLDELDT